MTVEPTQGTNNPVTPASDPTPDAGPSLLTPGDPAGNDPGVQAEPAQPAAKASGEENPWYAGLPEGTHELMKGFETPDQVVKILQDHKDRAADIPESSEGYKFPEGLPTPEKDLASFAKVAHEMGMTQKQVEALANWQKKANAEATESFNKVSEDWKQSVLKSWGADAEKNTELALRGVRDFASDDLKKILSESGFGNHPAIVEHFYKLGIMSAEGRAPLSDSTPGEEGIQRTATGQPMLKFNMGD
jgi:hypothetical protein